jgi:hypothetical protein
MIFWIYQIIFLKKKYVEYVHGAVDQVHQRRLTDLQTSVNVGRWLSDRRLRLN